MQEQKEVLAAAQAALTDAFGPNHKHTVKVTSTPAEFNKEDSPAMLQEASRQGLTTSDIIFSTPELTKRASEILKMAKSPRETELATAILRELSKVSSSELPAITEEIKNEFPTSYKYLFGNNPPNKSNGLTSSDLNAIVTEVGGKPIVSSSISKVIDACNQSTETPSKKKNIAETKKLLTTFHKRMEKYAKHLSVEGATAICVKLALHSPAEIDIASLPEFDQNIIKGMVSGSPFENSKRFYVVMDEVKDFQVIFSEDKEEGSIFYLFNTVIHPPFNQPSDVPIEQDGNKVVVGNSLVLDPQRVQKLVGNAPPEKAKNDEDDMPRRQVVSGRNAFEIRTDVLTLAVDWITHSNGKKTEEEVMRVAKLFYSFVEDRNRR